MPELGKGIYETCPHLTGSGCGIYAERPESCRTFRCQWLRGLLEVDSSIDTGMRPDGCGVIFDYQPDGAMGEMYTAWEVAAGASAREPAHGLLEGLAERFLVRVVSPRGRGDRDGGEHRFIGPR